MKWSVSCCFDLMRKIFVFCPPPPFFSLFFLLFFKNLSEKISPFFSLFLREEEKHVEGER